MSGWFKGWLKGELDNFWTGYNDEIADELKSTLEKLHEDKIPPETALDKLTEIQSELIERKEWDRVEYVNKFIRATAKYLEECSQENKKVDKIERLKRWILVVKDNLNITWSLEVHRSGFAILQCGLSVEESDIEKIYKFCDTIGGKYDKKIRAKEGRIALEFTTEEGRELYDIIEGAIQDTHANISRILINWYWLGVEMNIPRCPISKFKELIEKVEKALNTIVGSDIGISLYDDTLHVVASFGKVD